jgi:colanic acid biosynthesis glycosyl transferase WcaI
VKILLLNQYLPPASAPTAKLVGDLSDALQERGHVVKMIGARRHYRSGGAGVGRWFRELGDLFWLLLQLLASPRPDLILSLTSPPGLIVIAALGARWHRCRLWHWVMDVYPDVAIAAGQLRAGLLSAMLDLVFREGYRRCERILVLDEDMEGVLRHKFTGPLTVSPPWPPEIEISGDFSGWPGVPEGEPVWLYSGNLGQAHPWESLLRAQQIIEKETVNIHLVIQGGGMGWERVREHAHDYGLTRIHTHPYTSQDQLLPSLLRANVHIAGQNAEMRGLIWPSKLAVLSQLEAPLLWLGPTQSGISHFLTSELDAAVIEPDQTNMIAKTVIDLIRSGKTPSQELYTIKERIRSAREKALRRMVQWIES